MEKQMGKQIFQENRSVETHTCSAGFIDLAFRRCLGHR